MYNHRRLMPAVIFLREVINMQVKAECLDRKLTLHLTGELDHHAARPLMQSIAKEVEYALPVEVILDFSGVTFMDSSGIAVAIHTQQQMKQLGGKTRIINPSAQVKKVFMAAGIQKMIRMEDIHEK